MITLGCSKNTVDTQHILSQVEKDYEVVPEGDNRAVDYLLINTCGFIGDAKEESVQAILDGALRKKAGNAKKLFVLGCLSQRYMGQLPVLIPEVDKWFGARLVIASGNLPGAGLTTGELSSMFTYTTQILSSLMMLSMVFVMIIMSRAPMRRTTEILVEEPELKNHENPVETVKDGSVDFENVSFRYSKTADRAVLEHINLHIASGMTVGILGGTGSSFLHREFTSSGHPYPEVTDAFCRVP